MFDVTKVESENEVYISGVLNELDIVEGSTTDGRDWIRGTANVRVDQEINGIVSENIIPIKMFSMRLKKDGNPNKVYDTILGYKNSLTSLAAAEDESNASKITISSARLEENIWIDSSSGTERSSYQISGNFINKKRDADKEGATFKLSGVVIKLNEELDRNEEPTGRLLVKFGVIGYAGRMNLLTLIAEGNAKAHIEQNWQVGDTVRVSGRINMTQKTEIVSEKQGFGEDIEKTRTVTRRELIITGGSSGGLEEELSYDADSVKKACADRLARIKTMKDSASAKAAPKSRANDFGF